MMPKLYDYDQGYLPEGYDADWKKVGSPNGNPGHLFEWASLLSHAVELGADPKFIELGSRNIDMGLNSYNKDVGGLGGKNAAGVTLPLGATLTITATPYAAAGVALTGRAISWSTSN